MLVMAFKDSIFLFACIAISRMPGPSKILIHDIAKTFYVLHYVKNVVHTVLVDHNCGHGRLATT